LFDGVRFGVARAINHAGRARARLHPPGYLVRLL
jgi:hypothetical protein